MSEVTAILAALQQGDSRATEQLLPLVYDELRRLAAQKLASERPDHTLQPTALVHEAYLRLVGGDGRQQWENHAHFFGAAAQAMRRILVDNARQKQSQKRGGAGQVVPLDPDDVAHPERTRDLIALDEALADLETRDPQKAELVKLRFFAGLTMPEAASVLGISLATAERAWTFARAWLHRQLTEETP